METGLGILRGLLSDLLEKRQENESTLLGASILQFLNRNALDADKKDVVILFRVVNSLRLSAFQRLPQTKLRGVVLQTLDKFESILRLKHLVQPANSFVSKNRQFLESIRDNLELVEEVVPGAAISLDIAEVRNELERMKANVLGALEIDANTKSLIAANLDLVLLSADRIAVEGVSEFRVSVHCALGRLTLQLQDNSLAASAKEAVKESVDWLLRVAGMIEIGSNIAGLITYQPIAGLLAAPSS